MTSFGERATGFFCGLRAPRVPAGVDVMNPYRDARVRAYTRRFFESYFADDRDRLLILGINPGRFGAGVTGIAFTDPVALAEMCGIPNDLAPVRELSSVFIYEMIERLGGPGAFYGRFFLSAICPLGFTREGRNLNYYDEPRLERMVTPFIVSSVERHIAFGGRRDRVVILGRGKNARFFERLNHEHRWFDSVDALDHPRYIMQYRRRKLRAYIRKYEAALTG